MSPVLASDLQEYLSTLADLGARPQTSLSPADFTLERMLVLTVALGVPQQKYPSIHIAGTNGKGSVSALCAAALQAQGVRVGVFTSPHINGALDGIRIDGSVVSVNLLEDSFQLLLPHLRSRTDWTQFEVVTALAFLHFARTNVDAAVIEVGLGGRLDATNVLTPLVSVITPIDFDHTSILGNTLSEIAAEKAGIIKPGVPVVMAPQTPEAAKVIRNKAKDSNAPLVEVGKDLLFSRAAFDLQGQDLEVWSSQAPKEKTPLHIALLGAHQVENAATAYAALQAIKNSLPLTDENIRRGFAQARWPGRFELLQTKPALVLDAAHSPHAARALRQTLDDFFPAPTIVFVLGVSADKDLEGLLAPLHPRIGRVVATQSTHPRALPASHLAQRLAAMGIDASAEPDAKKALELAIQWVSKDDLVLVCGSVFLVELVRELYLTRNRGL